MSKLPDPIRSGLQRGWKVLGGPHGAAPQTIACDVAIIGSGAGAGITAELLTRAGLSVVIVEEGPLRSSSDFRQRGLDQVIERRIPGVNRHPDFNHKPGDKDNQRGTQN